MRIFLSKKRRNLLEVIHSGLFLSRHVFRSLTFPVVKGLLSKAMNFKMSQTNSSFLSKYWPEKTLQESFEYISNVQIYS